MPIAEPCFCVPSLAAILDPHFLTVTPEMSLIDVLSQMSQGGYSVAVVIGERDIQGLFCDRQLPDILASGYPLTTPIQQVMHRPVVTLPESEDISSALSLLSQQSLKALPVINQNSEILGLLTSDSVCQGIHQVSQLPKRQFLLNQIIQAMRGTLVLDEVLQNTVNYLHEGLSVNRCLIFQSDTEGNTILAATHVSEATDQRESLMGINCQFYSYYHSELAKGKVIHFSHIDGTCPYELQEAGNICHIRAILIVPLLYQNNYIGGISLHQCNQERDWQKEEIEFVQAIADHCAVAIQHAKIYQQAEQKIEEQRLQKIALKQTTERLQAILDTVPSGIVWISEEGRYLGVNRYIAQSVNLSPEDFIGKELGFLQVSPHFTTCMRQFLASDAQTLSTVIEAQIQAQTKYFLILAQKYNNKKAVVSVSIDITEAKQIDQYRQEQQALLRNVVDANPSLIFVKDREGRFILANQSLANIYGTTVENLIGKRDIDFNSNQAEVQAFLAADREVIDSLTEKNIPEETITNFQGEPRYFQTIKRPLLMPDQQEC
ncbi:MAG: GAF domain-containing protein, partial [Chroococcales cyanobacterium]